MSAWLSDEMSLLQAKTAGEVSISVRPSPLRRVMDLALLAPLLLFALVPLALIAMLQGGFARDRRMGLGGAPFDMLGFAGHGGWIGAGLARAGVGHWPVLLNILRGEMSWVGPRPRALEETVSPDLLKVRPGLFNPWFIRCRTAVDFGTEEQADAGYMARRSLRHDLGLLVRGTWATLLPAATRGAVAARIRLCDVALDNLDMAGTLDRLSARLDTPGTAQVCFVNPACVNIAARHRAYRRLLARASLVLPDGIGIRIATALLGKPLRQNVNGTDLFPRLCELLQSRGKSIYLLGGAPGVADQVAARIAENWPQLRVAGVQHGFFSTAQEGQVVAQVRAARADLLLVARGVPGQDLFIDRYLTQLGVKVAMGVGGLFDFVSGRISRAPVWMRESGLEWMWRLMQEPGRMWRRYLVGNMTFLGRVILQRAGLHHGRVEESGGTEVASERTVAPEPALRAVVFATTNATPDQPVAADYPLALVPLGHQTLIEQLLSNLAQAGVSVIDLAVSDRPNELRHLLGDGGRWGLRLHWHLVKDPAHAYAVLDKPALRSPARLLIGHADRCPSVGSLKSLIAGDQWRVDGQDEQGPRWSGWGSLITARLPLRCADLSLAALGQWGTQSGLGVRLSSADDGLALQSAGALLQAQPWEQDQDGESIAVAPPSWIRTPWGAMSPQATVDKRASIVGPVLIGPGCIVARGARIGPRVVLSRDVVVLGDTRVEHSVVMPGSYIGAGLNLDQCVVQGGSVRHVRLGVHAWLPPADSLMLSLHERPGPTIGGLGRLIAALALPIVGPVLLLHWLLRRAGGCGPAWVRRPVVLGCRRRTGAQDTVLLRLAPASAGRAARLWSLLAGVVDVAEGRRAWFGVHPRLAGQWYAIRPEWQQVLVGRPVGLFHAPAWTDDPALLAEASAAADVFAIVQGPLRRAVLFLQAIRRPLGTGLPRARP